MRNVHGTFGDEDAIAAQAQVQRVHDELERNVVQRVGGAFD